MTSFGFTVNSETDLNSAITAIDAGGADSGTNDAYSITLGSDIALGQDLLAVNLDGGGAGVGGGLLAFRGTNVTLQGVTFLLCTAMMLAKASVRSWVRLSFMTWLNQLL